MAVITDGKRKPDAVLKHGNLMKKNKLKVTQSRAQKNQGMKNCDLIMDRRQTNKEPTWTKGHKDYPNTRAGEHS